MKNLSSSLLLPAELAETSSAYLRVIEESGLDNSFVNGLTALVKEDLITLNKALTATRDNQLVDDVAKADAVRDDLFIGLRDLIDAYKRRLNPALLEAYEKLWPIIEKSGTTLYRLGYTEQSGKLEALFAELDLPEAQAALTALHATELYADLKQAQTDFVILYQQRLEVDIAQDYPTLREARGTLVPHLNSLLKALEILELTEPNVHTALLDKVDAITTAAMIPARARKTRSENQEVSPDE